MPPIDLLEVWPVPRVAVLAVMDKSAYEPSSVICSCCARILPHKRSKSARSSMAQQAR